MPTPIKLDVSSKVLEKLVDVIAKGIGAAFQPWQIRRIALAEADATRIRALAERQIAALPPVQPAHGASDVVEGEVIEDADPIPLVRRAEQRMLYREIQRQVNVEEVARQAYENLRGAEASDEPVDDDWIARFFGYAQDVSNADMQRLWGKILAGEVARPQTFSMRCLEVVRNLTMEEASLFQRVCPYVTGSSTIIRTQDDNLIPGEPFISFLLLSDAGLMDPSLTIVATYESVENDRFEAVIAYANFAILFRRPQMDPFQPVVYKLSEAGRQLLRVFAPKAIPSYVNHLVEWLKGEGFEVSLHERHGDNYDPTPIPLPLQ